MKVTVTKGEQFVPVIIILTCESQADVNALYAVGNTSENVRNVIVDKTSSPTTLNTLSTVLTPIWKALKNYATKRE